MHDGGTGDDKPGARLRRRRMLSAGFGAAAVLPLTVACGAKDSGSGLEFRSPHVTDQPAARNIRDFGAVGDGKADETAAFAAVAAVGDRPLVIYIPAGQYNVKSFPALPDYATVLGDGADVTMINYDGNGTLIELQRRQRVRFSRIGFYLSGPTATAVRLSNCFRCTFDQVVLRGNHLSDNAPRFVQQRGLVLDQNTGGTAVINCDINNFGYGLVTSCIQNYVTASKFTNNHISVLGTGGDHNAGLALANVEFVSDTDPRTTDRHILVDGPANDWWLTNVWFEGADTALSIGGSAGGPAQFGMVNCKVAARSVCLDLIYCRQPYLANVQFDPDLNAPPVEVRVDSKNVPEGTAINLVSGSFDDVDPKAFPDGWHVIGRGAIHGARFAGTTVAQATTADTDIFQAQDPGGGVQSAILGSGAFLSDRTEGGVVLKDSAGTYWRLSVDTDGSVKTSSLGKQRPHS
ncbi:glycosyl hydrolase family 28-related protein [Nocardia sp. NPDC088792]|uniref:glycosyl hydrolase family 28-related protein n=1 Tax=Nocardia sp. NPDC088792 TaxID=3364332 RepID=UPI0037F1AE0F